MAPTSPLKTVSVITLFVEDVAKCREFYTSVFDCKVVYQDESSTALELGSLIINLLIIDEAGALVKPRSVGTIESGKRCQMSVWVEDLDKIIKFLETTEVKLLTGPELQVWGMKTITFEDPAGNNWEVAQKMHEPR